MSALPVLGALAAGGISYLVTPIVTRVLTRARVFALPGGRHIHARPIPKGGGWAIVFGFFCALAGIALIRPEALHFVDQKIGGFDKNLLGVIAGGIAIALGGFLDDRFTLKPSTKLLLQLGVALLVPLFGIYIFHIRNPFGVTLQFADFAPLATVLWVLMVTNTVNYLDGVDGLAAGVGFLAAFFIAVLSALPEVAQPATALLSAVLAGAIFGFLPFNVPPARVFLGDTGSQFIGYMLAVFALISGGKVATVALILGIPILDVVWVSARRMLRGTSPFRADRLHLHHRLLDAGFAPRAVLAILWGFAALLGTVSLATTTVGKFHAALIVIGLMAVIATALVLLEWKKGKQHG